MPAERRKILTFSYLFAADEHVCFNAIAVLRSLNFEADSLNLRHGVGGHLNTDIQ